MLRRKLLIISDTRLNSNNGINYAFEPVAKEINYIRQELNLEIFWIGFDHSNSKFKYPMYELNSKIKVKLFPSVGIKFMALRYILNFFYSIILFFYLFFKVRKYNYIHTRCPSLPGFIGIILSLLYKNKIWWHKYAGNWAEVNPPLSYFLQKSLLLKASQTKVTINGFWSNQHKHCISFENPCLTHSQLLRGKSISNLKVFNKPYRFVFVGRLEDPKGVQRIIDSFKLININELESIDFIGDGSKIEYYKLDSRFLGSKVCFHGFLSGTKVHEILERAHFLLLPSTASEGFPKVIAEAACYGTIPIVSDVGSIGHYINNKNGIVLNHMDIDNNFKLAIEMIFSNFDYEKFDIDSLLNVAEKFSFEYFVNKLGLGIFSD
jgi:glycosyltransferase involved in cell wall biosynthesis